MTFNGYTNWESYAFSLWWSNDESIYDAFVERAAGLWHEHGGDPERIGDMIVRYARENYTGSGEGASVGAFSDIETDAEWEAIDREEVGEEIREAMTAHGRYAHLLEDEAE